MDWGERQNCKKLVYRRGRPEWAAPYKLDEKFRCCSPGCSVVGGTGASVARLRYGSSSMHAPEGGPAAFRSLVAPARWAVSSALTNARDGAVDEAATSQGRSRRRG